MICSKCIYLINQQTSELNLRVFFSMFDRMVIGIIETNKKAVHYLEVNGFFGLKRAL